MKRIFTRKHSAQPVAEEYKKFHALRLVSLLCLASFLVGIVVILLFVYQTMIQSFTQAQSIVILQTDLAIEAIDQARFTLVSTAWQGKLASSVPPAIANPFIMVSSTLASPTSTVIVPPIIPLPEPNIF